MWTHPHPRRTALAGATTRSGRSFVRTSLVLVAYLSTSVVLTVVSASATPGTPLGDAARAAFAICGVGFALLWLAFELAAPIDGASDLDTVLAEGPLERLEAAGYAIVDAAPLSRCTLAAAAAASRSQRIAVGPSGVWIIDDSLAPLPSHSKVWRRRAAPRSSLSVDHVVARVQRSRDLLAEQLRDICEVRAIVCVEASQHGARRRVGLVARDVEVSLPERVDVVVVGNPTVHDAATRNIVIERIGAIVPR